MKQLRSLHDLADSIATKALNRGLLAPYLGRAELRDLILSELAGAGLGAQVADELRDRCAAFLVRPSS